MSGFWVHFCPCEGCVLAVKLGEPCNWCYAPQPTEPPPTHPDAL